MAITTERPKKGRGEALEVLQDHAASLAGQGAREMLMAAVSGEVDVYLGVGRY